MKSDVFCFPTSPKEIAMKKGSLRLVPLVVFTLLLAGCEGLPTETTVPAVTTTTAVVTTASTAAPTTTAPALHTISFDSAGGTDVTPITAPAGFAVTEPAAPTRTGYDFAGWYSDTALEDPFVFATMPAGDLVLHADWGTAGLAFQPTPDESGYLVSAGDAYAVTEITIPRRHLGLPVTGITAEGFENLANLTAMTIPEGILEIGNGAFTNCTALVAVVLPDGLLHIGDTVFAFCANLMDVTLPDSVQDIGQAAFRYCVSLCEVILPAGLVDLPDDLFAYCTALAVVTLPAGVDSIGSGAFQHCESLLELVLPDGVTVIFENAFSGCTGLIRIALPATLVTIEFSAFSGCESLTSIVIPVAVATIRWNAFYGCTSLSIFAEADARPTGWSDTWNSGDRPVYWAGEWEYVAGVPTPNA